jgi:steroid delta-isomerase-like uncharacterized protein
VTELTGPAVTSGMPSGEPPAANADQLRGLIDLFNRGRFSALDEFGKSLDDRMTFDNPITGPTDKAGMRNLHVGLWTAFPDFDYEVKRMVSEGDTVVWEGVFKGTHKGDLMGLPPTNKQVALPLAFAVEFHNGLITNWRTYLDQTTLMRQVGKGP